MKASLDWLNAYLDRPVTLEEAETLLTAQGFPFDGPPTSPDGRDQVPDVEVTSNRSDCLSHIGLAREIAAGSARALNVPAAALPAASCDAAATLATVDLQAPDLCPLYTARVIRGVKVKPSPDWLVRRLEAIGLRSVNNVVDVTNYVLFEYGQPLHAFDLNQLHGGKVVIRQATAGEKFAAIDGTTHELRTDMLVIADADRPVAVAGVMGGLESEVSEATTDVLLESAIFAPLSVRRTSRALKLASDSSYRFERGVDPRGVEQASQRAAQLIIDLAGGELAEGVIREGADDPTPVKVSMRVKRCTDILGFELSAVQMRDYLDALLLEPTISAAGDVIECDIPTWRLDLLREIDLIEEVARLHGLDQAPTTDKIHIVARPPQAVFAARQVLGEVLTAHGYHEAITFSFLEPAKGKPFVPTSHEPLLIDDDRRKLDPMLRPSVLPSLMNCRKFNQDVGNADVKLFEAAHCWTQEDGQVRERRMVGLLADAEKPQEGLRQMRGAIEELFERLIGVVCDITPCEDATFEPAAEVRVDGNVLGRWGLVKPAIQKQFDLQTPIVAADLALEPLLASYPPERKASALSRFPGIERDLSVVVEETVSWEAIESTVREAKPALLESLAFIGVYRGKPIESGRKSMTFRMLYRDPGRTLRHDQVDPQVTAIVAGLKSKVGAEVRG